MKLYKPVSTLLALLFTTGWVNLTAQDNQYVYTSYDILPESKIELRGTTNINQFDCYTGNISSQISAFVMPSPHENSLLLKDSKIKIAVSSLECGQEAINKDLRKTLDAEDHPDIVVELTRVHYIDTKEQPKGKVAIDALLHIAGASEPACIALQGKLDEKKGFYNVQGEHRIKLTDFDIEPPRTFFGLIKVQDEIVIVFDFSFRKNQQSGDFREMVTEQIKHVSSNH